MRGVVLRGLTVLGLGLLVAGPGAVAARAEVNGAVERVFGRVVAVDSRRGRVLLEHGALETAGRGVELCVVARRELARLRRGSAIDALADTSRRPWRLIDVDMLRPRASRRVPATRSDFVRIAATGLSRRTR